MARAGKAHTSEDIWHLSIEDLLAPPQEPPRVPGRGPFVINLSTSTARIGPPPKGLRRFDGLHLYELRRGPEERPRFLLRLGIIATEIEADAILSSVLEHYPSATKDSAEDDDRAAIARARAAEPAKPAPPPAEKPVESRQSPPRAAPPTPAVAAKPQEPIRWDIDELLPDLPVTRPSRPEAKASKDGPPVIRTPVTDSPRAQAPGVGETSVERDRSVRAPSLAAGKQPPMREPPASSKAAPTREVVNEIDYDPNEITQEVETPTFTFDALETEAPVASAARKEDASPARSREPDPMTVESSTLEETTAEAPTVEVPALDAITFEPPAADETATETPILEAHEIHEFTFDAPAVEAAATEAPPIEAREFDEITSDAPPAEVAAPEAPIMEADDLDDEITSDAPAEVAAPEAPIVEADDLDDEITIEAPVIPAAAIEAALIEAREFDAITSDAPPAEAAATEVPIIEAHDLDDEITIEAPVIQVTATDMPLTEGHELDGGALETSAPEATRTEAPPQATATTAPGEDPASVPTATQASLEDVQRAGTAPVPTDEAPATPARPAERASPPPRVPAAEPAPAAPSIDNTQTIRALTPLELADNQASQWFSIQLALCEEPVDPEHVPNLDIFNEYRLYCVTGLHEDRVMHALRLGFFSSALAAEAVAGYLRGFFDSPCIKRVSVAERERFAESGVAARKDIGATGMHAVIELAGPPPLPERQIPLSDSGKRRAPASVWSRLVGPLKR